MGSPTFIALIRKKAGLPHRKMSANDPKRTWWPDVTYKRNARAPVMAGVKVTCVCGAIYEVIETKGPSREARPFKCVLCDRELFAWDGDNVGQLHLVWRPDEDRE